MRKKYNSKNPLKIEELIKIKQNFCKIVGNMSRLCSRKHAWSLLIDNYNFSVNIKDCLFLEFDMPHIEQPLQLIILSIKVNKNKKLFFVICI